MDEEITGTADEPVSGDQPTIAETTSGESSATPAVETPAAPQEESFIDTSSRKAEIMARIKGSPDLAQAYDWMYAPYQKSRSELKQGREAVAQVQRFHQDLAYQDQILREVATRRGLRIVGPDEQAQPVATGQTNGATPAQAPAHLVETIKAGLAPELQWMAKSLADTNWAAVLEATKPLMQQREQETRSKIQSDIEAASEELGQQFPGWEVEEDAMNDVFEWLSSGQMKHAQYGNRMTALYKFTQMLKGHNGHAVQEAGKRMAEAARNRTVSSQATTPSTTNWQEQIRGAKTSRDAFAMARKQAEEELRGRGFTIPD